MLIYLFEATTTCRKQLLPVESNNSLYEATYIRFLWAIRAACWNQLQPVGSNSSLLKIKEYCWILLNIGRAIQVFFNKFLESKGQFHKINSSVSTSNTKIRSIFGQQDLRGTISENHFLSKKFSETQICEKFSENYYWEEQFRKMSFERRIFEQF